MLRLSANISTLFTEWPILDRPAAAADAGFSAIEIQFPYEVSAERWAAATQAADVEVVLINLPAGRLDKGDLGTACLPDRQQDFREAMARAIDYAAALNCRRVNCLSGKLRAHDDPAVCWRQLVEAVGLAATTFGEHGVQLLVEPLNAVDQPAFLLNSLAKADALLAEVDHPNLALQYDVYHVRANREDWLGAIAPRLDRIGHVQFSDYPGRGEPGAGELDFRSFFQLMERLPYTGWIGCEYRSTAMTLDSFAWRQWLRSTM